METINSDIGAGSVTEAAPQTHSEKPLRSSTSPATDLGGDQVPLEPFALIIGGHLKIGCYRISTVPLNFALDKLVITNRSTSVGGWQVRWETVGFFATLGGACGRLLQEKIREPGRDDVDRLLNLEQRIESAIKKINSDCTAANKFIYTLKHPKKGTKRGEKNAPKHAAE